MRLCLGRGVILSYALHMENVMKLNLKGILRINGVYTSAIGVDTSA